jgi:hypothetical protein
MVTDIKRHDVAPSLANCFLLFVAHNFSLEQIEVGNGPVNLLYITSMYSRFVQAPTDEGNLPLNWFSVRVSSFKAVHRPAYHVAVYVYTCDAGPQSNRRW